MTKKLTKIRDFTEGQILDIIFSAFEFQKKYKKWIRREDILKWKVVSMVFEKPSLRTKVAFESATTYLWWVPIFLSSGQIFASGNNEKWRESIYDIAKNLERFSDLILARVYSHDSIEQISQSINIPVINALCDKYHPTQALADLMAIIWHKWQYKWLKLAFIWDWNNVSTSLMHICTMMWIDFAIASPKWYEIPKEEIKDALIFSKQNNSKLLFFENPEEIIQDADIVYTDTFISMWDENEKDIRLKDFKNYQVNIDLFKKAKSDAIFMHCLPAHRWEEVTNEIMDCKNSVIFDQAECRMHIAKALLYYFLV